MLLFALRAIAARFSVSCVECVRALVVGVRVAVRDTLAERAGVCVMVVREDDAVRDDVFVVVRGATFRLAVRGVVEAFMRGTVVRSRNGCDCLIIAFVMRDVAIVLADASGVFDFCRVVVTVFVAPRRVAARTASSDSFAHTSPIPSNARHTAKIILVPFILIWVSVANLRKSGQVKYEINIRFLDVFWCGQGESNPQGFCPQHP